MIDTTRSYTTRAGKRVVIHEVVLRNSVGALVTFPVKGSVIDVERGNPRLKTRYNIWTLDGRARPGHSHPDDIMELIKENAA